MKTPGYLCLFLRNLFHIKQTESFVLVECKQRQYFSNLTPFKSHVCWRRLKRNELCVVPEVELRYYIDLWADNMEWFLDQTQKGNNRGRCPTTFDELVNIDEQSLTNVFFPGGFFLLQLTCCDVTVQLARYVDLE